MVKPVEKDHSTVKLLVAVLLIISGLGWTFYRVNKVRPGAVANNGVTEEFRPPSPEEMDKARREMYAYANITPEQQKQLEVLWQKARAEMERRRAETTQPQRMGPPAGGGPPGGGPAPGMMMGPRLPREMQQELDKILSKEQQDKMREYFRNRMQQERAKREAKLKAALGEQEFQRYQEKQRERRRGGFPGFGGRGARGGQQGQSGQSGQQSAGGRP